MNIGDSDGTPRLPAKAAASFVGKLLKRLQAAPGAWISKTELRSISGCASVDQSLQDLRKRYGFPVVNRLEWRRDHWESSYRLEVLP